MSFDRSFVARLFGACHDNQKVQVTIRSGVAASVRSKEINALRRETLKQTPANKPRLRRYSFGGCVRFVMDLKELFYFCTSTLHFR